jgi:cell division protein FtsB
MKPLPRISRKATLGILAVYLLLSLYKSVFDTGGILDHKNLQVTNQKLQNRIAELEAQADSLDLVKNKLESDSSFIQHQLRTKLGMVKPGEEIYIFHNKAPQ